MGKKKNVKTGRYEKGQTSEDAGAEFARRHAEGEEIARRQRQDEIIQRFVDANAEPEPPIPTPAEEEARLLAEQAAAAMSEMNAAIAIVKQAMNQEPPPIVPRPSQRMKWAISLSLAVGVVAGGLMGAAAKDREWQPILANVRNSRHLWALQAQRLGRVSTNEHQDILTLLEQNARLAQERGGAIQTIDQARDTAKAAAHDLRRADRALQYDQSVDRVSDRAKTWEALRAVEKAERRLNEQP